MAVSKKMISDTIPAIRTLVIHDNRADINKIKYLLSSTQGLTFPVVSTISTALIKQNIKKCDIIIFCLNNKHSKYIDIVKILKEHPTTPVVTISNTKQAIQNKGIKIVHSFYWQKIEESHLIDTLNSVVYKNITNKKLNDNLKEYQEHEARFLNVILHNIDGIVIVNRFRKILFINPSAQNMLCLPQEFSDKNDEFPYDIQRSSSQELQICKSDDKQVRYLEMRVSDIQWDNKAAFLISLRDISSRKLAEQSLKTNEERYTVAIKGSNDGLWDWDVKNGTIYFSDQWKVMLGYNNDDLNPVPDTWFELIHPEDISVVKKAIKSHLQGKTAHFENEHRIRNVSGNYIWVLVRGTVVRDKNGKALRFAGSQTDITERKEAEKELRKSLDEMRFALASEKILMDELDRKNKELIELSITDGLTGMYNHRFLQERFDYEFKRVRRYGGLLSCMIIDIDHFKLINDNHGHQIGDQVLRDLAHIMKQNSREIDICGRYGGEEFMIITNLQMENALKFATKLHTAIDNHKFQYGSHSLHVTVSIGIAEYNSEIKTKQELLERADIAMYQAKMDGRNLIRIWKEIEENQENAIDKLGILELKGKFQALSNQMRMIYMESTNALIKAVDAKDPFAKEHSRNVSEYSVLIAKQLKLPESEIEIIRYAALLHDIGKIGIRDDILIKKDELTEGEYEVLRRHPEVAVNILRDIKFLEKEIPMILHHHERYDGKGYPHGLRAREIPIGAQIIALADAFDAMTSGRTYKNRLSWKNAIKEIKNGSGTQFAPDIVSAFISLVESEKIVSKGLME